MKSSLLSLIVITLTVVPCACEIPPDPRHASEWKKDPSDKEVERERKWMAVDKTSSSALQAYLDLKPKGSRHKEATTLLPIVKKLEAITAGTAKPTVVIPSRHYGDDVEIHNQKLAVAISYDRKKRVGNDIGACWDYDSIDYESRRSFSKGVFAHGAYASWPGRFRGAPGSILAFDSGGERCPSEKYPVIVTTKRNIVYFGLIKGVGFVHLAGEGEVVYPDGKTVRFH